MFKTIHIIGIGGIGMSALAEIAHHRGFVVQGSDNGNSENIARLNALGIKIFNHHNAENIKGADCVVYSTAIAEDNCECLSAKKGNIVLWHRADMLAWLMEGKRTITVSGTHGKTTTTALISTILEAANFDPTIISGGIINNYNSNSRFGKGDWMVVEGDESDGSFSKLPTEIAVITNIDEEHLKHYGSFNNLIKAFEGFASGAKSFAVLCIDDAQTKALKVKPEVKCLYYSLAEAFEMQNNEDKTKFRLADSEVEMVLPMLGGHNVQNALAAIATARSLGISFEKIALGLAAFKGVARRFALLGEVAGVKIYDDYAHHPKEIIATLKTARNICKGKLIAIVQPHRFSRLKDLFNEFTLCLDEADIIAITPVYAAGEPAQEPNEKTLISALQERGKEVYSINSAAQIGELLKTKAIQNDIIIGMGAGSISAWMKEVFDVA